MLQIFQNLFNSYAWFFRGLFKIFSTVFHILWKILWITFRLFFAIYHFILKFLSFLDCKRTGKALSFLKKRRSFITSFSSSVPFSESVKPCGKPLSLLHISSLPFEDFPLSEVHSHRPLPFRRAHFSTDKDIFPLFSSESFLFRVLKEISSVSPKGNP